MVNVPAPLNDTRLAPVQAALAWLAQNRKSVGALTLLAASYGALELTAGKDIARWFHGRGPLVTTPLSACTDAICQKTRRVIANSFKLWKTASAGTPNDILLGDEYVFTALMGLATIETRTGFNRDRAGSDFRGVFQFSDRKGTAYEGIADRTLELLQRIPVSFTIDGKAVAAANLTRKQLDYLMFNQTGPNNTDAEFLQSTVAQTFAAIETIHHNTLTLSRHNPNILLLSPTKVAGLNYLMHNLPLTALMVATNYGDECTDKPLYDLIDANHHGLLASNPAVYGNEPSYKFNADKSLGLPGSYTPTEAMDVLAYKMSATFEVTNQELGSQPDNTLVLRVPDADAPTRPQPNMVQAAMGWMQHGMRCGWNG